MALGGNSKEIAQRVMGLKSELEDLELKENELDLQKGWVQQSIRNVTEDSENLPYPFYTNANRLRYFWHHFDAFNKRYTAVLRYHLH